MVPGRLEVEVGVDVDVEADGDAVDEDLDAAEEAVTPGRTRRVKLGIAGARGGRVRVDEFGWRFQLLRTDVTRWQNLLVD